MDLGLQDKVAVVTGVSQGIGAATAARLVDEGALVVGCSRRVPADLPKGVTHLALDLQEPDSAGELIARTIDSAGGLDIVVNNVGGGTFASGYADLDDEAWASMLDLNLLTAVRVIRAAQPHLRPGGAIINVSSVNGDLPSPNIGVYSAAKAALNNLTAGLAGELAPARVRVVGVAPGPVDTPLWLGDHGAGAMIAAATGQDKDDVIAAARADQPFGRFSSAEEIADLIAFLASPRAGTISGTTIRVDGGRTGTV